MVWAAISLNPARRNSLSYRLDFDSPPPPPASFPGVVVLCPGRNEAEHLPSTLRELCEQDYPNYRVVFIDDHSDDATPTITAELAAKFAHLTVFRNEIEPPEGWVGKCWAVYRGYEALREHEARTGEKRAELVCFTDADIHWDPDCLRYAVGHMLEHDAGLVALFPKLTFGSRLEALVQCQMVLALGILYPFDYAMDPKRPEMICGGAFILTRRRLYDAIGGHESVKGQIIEDINLGRKLKQAGAKVRLAVTKDLFHGRMYESWPDMWEGLTKNAYAGMEYRWRVFALVVLVTPVVNILPSAWLFVAGALSVWSPGVWSYAALATSLAAVVLQVRPMNAVRKVLNLPWGYAFSLPVGSALYLSIIVASFVHYHRGGNRWKGRSYRIRGVQGVRG